MKANRVTGAAAVLLSGVIVVACSSSPTPSATPSPTPSPVVEKKEPVLYTGKNCLSQMANAAARWQPDAMPVHMESNLNAESTGHDGKSSVWRAMFASASRGTNRTFTCSGSRLKEEAPIGVTVSSELASSPDMNRSMFQSMLLIVDSDKAYATAQENGGANLLKKDPQQPVIYSLDWDGKRKELVWGIMYGSSRSDSKGVGVVDATTGKFLRAGK
ncbi:MAG: hypothetical protein LAO56_04435 [Acidobacteriia bacterium]|nr:hypothetical protein [Terriglobia bacterium]